MSKPTVGRVVWFHGTGSGAKYSEQPMAAIITYVLGDTCVNLAVFDHGGLQFAATSVALVHDRPATPYAYECEWMPYQKGRAAKTDELERAIAQGYTPLSA